MIKKIFADACAAYLLGLATKEDYIKARNSFLSQDERFYCCGVYNQKCLPLPE